MPGRALLQRKSQPGPLLQDLISLGDSRGCVWASQGTSVQVTVSKEVLPRHGDAP